MSNSFELLLTDIGLIGSISGLIVLGAILLGRRENHQTQSADASSEALRGTGLKTANNQT
jgi:hypothetical protein